MSWIFILLSTLLCLNLVACSSASRKEESTRSSFPATDPLEGLKNTTPKTNNRPSIDYDNLQRQLGLGREVEQLGFVEKSFATCDAGYGYSSSQDCRRDFFVVIHFQLLCRDSQGTISTILNPEDLRALSGRSVSWTLQRQHGDLRLDQSGYGQIKLTAPRSQRSERLKLTVENDFLFLRAGEINRVVTPVNWCN